MAVTYDQIETEYKKLMNLDNDPLLFRIIFSAFLANFMKGPPVWLVVIGAAGSGKTELITSFSKSKRAQTVSSVSPAALLSFTSRDTSLLYVANNKVIIVKDMSTITQSDRKEKMVLYGYLRDCYDGQFKRFSGMGEIEWEGKVGFMGAGTPIMESEADFNNLLGERFIYLRMRPQGNMKTLDTMFKGGNTARQNLKEAIQDLCTEFIDSWVFGRQRVPQHAFDLLKECAIGIAAARASVVRDHRDDSIVFPAECYEVPTRIANMLMRIIVAAYSLGSTDDQVNQILYRFTYDSIPLTRARILKEIVVAGTPLRVPDVASKIRLSKRKVHRDLEELTLLGVTRKNTDASYEISNKTVIKAIEVAK